MIINRKYRIGTGIHNLVIYEPATFIIDKSLTNYKFKVPSFYNFLYEEQVKVLIQAICNLYVQ